MLEQGADLVGRMLAVAVDLHDGVCADVDRIAKAGTQRAADPEVDRQPDHRRPGPFGDRRRAIGTGVVDDHAVVAEAEHLGDHLSDACLLVVRRDDDDDIRHVWCSKSLTRLASSAWASAVVRNRSCSSETLIES